MTGSSSVRCNGSSRQATHQAYLRRRARQIAYGRWEPWTDAGPARSHVRRLRDGGASYRAIAEAAGVGLMTVHNLLNGCVARQRRLPDRISRSCAERLLAVTDLACIGARRNACGSRRRLQALVALGHSPAALARETGIPPQRLARLLRGQTQTVSTTDFAVVCGVYRELWNKLSAERTGRERVVADRARR